MKFKMTDQELLTYAAKAAGIEYSHVTSAGLYLDGSEDNFWSPLNSGADAFQLMVKLNIQPIFSLNEWGNFVNTSSLESEYDGEEFKAPEEKSTATRRAIVMAAAEIGKGIHQSQKPEGLPDDNYYKTQAESEIGKGM